MMEINRLVLVANTTRLHPKPLVLSLSSVSFPCCHRFSLTPPPPQIKKMKCNSGGRWCRAVRRRGGRDLGRREGHRHRGGPRGYPGAEGPGGNHHGARRPRQDKVDFGIDDDIVVACRWRVDVSGLFFALIGAHGLGVQSPGFARVFGSCEGNGQVDEWSDAERDR